MVLSLFGFTSSFIDLSRVECSLFFFFVIICFSMYPAMTTITVATTPAAAMRPIATFENALSWVVCLSVASSPVSKVVVVSDVETFTVDVVGEVKVVDETVEVSTRVVKVVSRCFVVDTDVSDPIAVLELGYVEEFAFDIDSVAVLVQLNVQSIALDEAKHCQQLSLLLNVPLCMQVPFM